MVVYKLAENKPEGDGVDCLVWMGSWWSHVIWCEAYNNFLTGHGELLRKRIDLWFYAPANTKELNYEDPVSI